MPRMQRRDLRIIGRFRDGRPIWEIAGGCEDCGDPEHEAAPPAQDGPDAGGFPANTPLSEMTPEQREAYWRHQARKHEQRNKERADYDDLKAKAARLDEIEAANATEQERAVRAAREEARAEALREAAPRAVRAEFRAAAKGVLTDAQLDALLEDLDLTRYLDGDGEVDVDKVAGKVKAFAPQGHEIVDLGQGRDRGGNTPKTTAREKGRAEAERRWGKRSA